MVVWLFLVVPWVCLRFVIVAVLMNVFKYETSMRISNMHDDNYQQFSQLNMVHKVIDKTREYNLEMHQLLKHIHGTWGEVRI